MQLPIANGLYKSDSLPLSHQTCINAYPFISQVSGTLSQESLFGTPGIWQAVSTGDIFDANRGAIVKGGILYIVNGNNLYNVIRSFDSDGNEVFTANELGEVEGGDRVSLAHNGTQLMILNPGGKGYIYNEDDATPFQEITDLDFPANGNPQLVLFIDGYFACITDTKKWIVSALNDGTSWNALDFGSAESSPDEIISMVVHNNQVFILGTETTEGFQNVGGFGFPFERNNVFLDKGCSAPFAAISAYGTFFMLGAGENESPSIYAFQGNNYTPISTNAIDQQIQKYTDVEISEVFSWQYSEGGANFVGWTFPDTTFVFDITTKRWHERKSFIDGVVSRWRVNSIVTAYGRLFCGDYVDGRVGVIDIARYDEYDNNILREWTTQPFAAEGDPISLAAIELTMEAGTGNDDVNDPSVALEISKDARIFNYPRIRSIGKKGEYERRTIWRKNGRFPRFAVMRFSHSDKSKFVAIKLEAR